MRFQLLAAATSSLVCTSAFAATITVSPSSSITSLTTALQIANAGDTIVLKKGLYHEAVLIPSGLDGLTIRGVGNPVLDARVVSGLELGAAILVQAGGVTIRDLTIQNAATVLSDTGDGIRTVGADTHVSGCTFIGNESAGVRTGAHGLSITKCTFVGNGFGVAIDTANDAHIEKSTFRGSIDAAIRLSGAQNATIEKCGVEGAAASGGIDADNSVTNPGLTVRNCKIRGVLGPAIACFGDGLVIEKCKISDSVGHGVFVRDSLDTTIRSTSFSNLLESSSAIVLATVTGVLIESCSATDIASAGLSLGQVAALDARACTFKRGGRQLEPCVSLVNTTDIAFEKITIVDWGEGFDVGDANDITLTACSVSKCVRDGYDVTALAGAVTLTKCKASGCAAEGLDNSGTATQATDCSFTGNRLDVTNDGALTLTGGSFGSGGTGTAPAID